MTNEEYHEHPAVSRSGIVKLLKSPAHYKTPTETTRPMEIGTVFHSWVLEGRKDFIISPFDSYRTKEAKEWKATQTQIILTKSEVFELESMRAAVHRADVFPKGVAEQTYIFTEPTTGVECKVRPDWMAEDGYIYDLKTTFDASERGFRKSVWNARLDIQAAFYLDGIEYATGKRPKGFRFVNVEKSAPYGVSVYELNDEWIEDARLEYIEALEKFKQCNASDSWPDYGTDVKTLLK